MSKFRIKMKLQGFELEVEGTREDAATISQNIGQQLSSMIQPVSGIVEGEVVKTGNSSILLPQIIDHSAKRGRRARRAVTATSTEIKTSPTIELTLSPQKFGNPKQHWKTADKALWLIYVLQENDQGTEFSTRILTYTFNAHFKQSGTVTASNVSRDLGRLKTGTTPPVIGENNSKSPSTWFLTEAGVKRAQSLIAEALGEAA